MKIKVLHTNNTDGKKVKKTVEEVTKIFQDLGIDINFEIKKAPFDEYHKAFYKSRLVWATCRWKWMTFFSEEAMNMLNAFYGDGADNVCFYLNSKMEKDIWGWYQQYNGKNFSQIYSNDKDVVYRQSGSNFDFYERPKGKGQMSRDTYILMHEVLHHLERAKGHDDLHDMLVEGHFFTYAEEICSWYNTVMKFTKGTKGEWRLTQGFGENGVCRKPNGLLYIANKCIAPAISIYKYLGLLGHNGLDFACPIGWRLYFNVVYPVSWTCWNASSPTYGNKITLISNSPILFKELPKQINKKDVEQYKTANGWELHVSVTYRHLGKFKAKSGSIVNYGDYIATTGNSGLSTAPHTHEEVAIVHKDGTAVSKHNGYGGAFDHSSYYI